MPTLHEPVTTFGVQVGRVSDTLTAYNPGRFREAPPKLDGQVTENDHEADVERTLLVVEREEPDGSLIAQEDVQVVGELALLTETTIVTPEELGSRIRLGEGVIMYVSPAAFAR